MAGSFAARHIKFSLILPNPGGQTVKRTRRRTERRALS
jgi:hypothetical protein